MYCCSVKTAPAFAISILTGNSPRPGSLNANSLPHRQAVVHSVYRKTVNVLYDGTLLSLQAADTVLSPISLITPLSAAEISALPVSEGERVAIDTANCKIQDLTFAPKLSPGELDCLTKRLEAVLSKSEASGFADTVVRSRAETRMRAAAEAIRRNRFPDAAEELTGLIGLGGGLTPGGDDFLCGVLAAIRLLDASEPSAKLPDAAAEAHEAVTPVRIFADCLKAQIRLHLQDTNSISSAFLSCALLDQFSFPVVHLPQAASAEEIRSAFSAVGHSSGFDTLAGIYFLLTQGRSFS